MANIKEIEEIEWTCSCGREQLTLPEIYLPGTAGVWITDCGIMGIGIAIRKCGEITRKILQQREFENEGEKEGVDIEEEKAKERTCEDCFYYDSFGGKNVTGLCNVVSGSHQPIVKKCRPECRFFRSRKVDEQ